MTAKEWMAMKLYLIAPVQIVWHPIPGIPRTQAKMWEDCSDEEKQPWLRLAGEILEEMPAMMAAEVRDCGT